MRTIYIDSDFKCHVSNDGTLRVIETDEFDGMCNAYIEGFRFVPSGESWTRSDGVVFKNDKGTMVFPWKPLSELEATQREYERRLILDMKTALNKLGVTLDE